MPTAKTALVLSAGGMFGAWQAGVWKALEHTLKPDLVVGASVGALNGWMIAAGCSGEELANHWLDPASGNALTLVPNYGVRNGWFDPRPLGEIADRLVANGEPIIPFALPVLQLPRLRTVLVRHPNITAAHLVATCSIPLFLPSVAIDGKRYVDGGFLEKLPIRAAIEMGATRIVAVDAMPEFGGWWFRQGVRAVRMFAPRRPARSRVDTTVITPSERLGDVKDAIFWKRENIERWIDLGQRDAAISTHVDKFEKRS